MEVSVAESRSLHILLCVKEFTGTTWPVWGFGNATTVTHADNKRRAKRALNFTSFRNRFSPAVAVRD